MNKETWIGVTDTSIPLGRPLHAGCPVCLPLGAKRVSVHSWAYCEDIFEPILSCSSIQTLLCLDLSNEQGQLYVFVLIYVITNPNGTN